MEKMKFCIVSLFAMFFIGCDASTYTRIIVENNSSHDLRIDFVIKDNAYLSDDHRDQYKIIDMMKGERTTFSLSGFGPITPRNPNGELEKVIFFDLEAGELIREIGTVGKTLFTEVYTGDYEAHYLLEITDELLF